MPANRLACQSSIDLSILSSSVALARTVAAQHSPSAALGSWARSHWSQLQVLLSHAAPVLRSQKHKHPRRRALLHKAEAMLPIRTAWVETLPAAALRPQSPLRATRDKLQVMLET